jgi:hypothetical protein
MSISSPNLPQYRKSNHKDATDFISLRFRGLVLGMHRWGRTSFAD